MSYQKEYHAAHYQKNKEAVAERRRAYYQANKEKILARCAEYRANNKEKIAAYHVEHYVNNKEKIQAYIRGWNQENKDSLKETSAIWRSENREKTRGYCRKWASENPDKVRAIAAKKRASKLRATAPWADEFILAEMYDLAARRTEATGIEWHVDHIVPLRSSLVCGLHCEANLRVITGKDNVTKGNRHWPDMP